MAHRPHSLRTYFNSGSIPFWSIHVAAIVGVVLLGFSWTGLLLAVGFYFARMFFITAGYHRYFSHRSFKTSRVVQFLLGFGAQSGLQRGVLWWAAKHRAHHRYSDTPDDTHSSRQDGFWYAHLGWSTNPTSWRVDYDTVKDLRRFPEIAALDRAKHLPAILLAAVLLLVGGPFALVWAFFVSQVLLWHGTFTINSLAHVIGNRRYSTTDDSKNHWGLALLTLGEGWHNNHHHYMTSARQGFFWWEVDITYYVLRGMALVGLVWDIKRPPTHVLENRPKHPIPTLDVDDDVIAPVPLRASA